MSGWETVKAMVRERDRDRLRRRIASSDPEDRVPGMPETKPWEAPAGCSRVMSTCSREKDCQTPDLCGLPGIDDRTSLFESKLNSMMYAEEQGSSMERAYRKGWNDALRNVVAELKK